MLKSLLQSNVSIYVIMYRALQIFLLFVGLLNISAIKLGSCNASIVGGCKERERQALLKFRQGLYDLNDRLSSWVGEDCCRWRGVGCSNETGNVLELDLRNSYAGPNRYNDSGHGWALVGKINPSLLDLKHLNYLDLSFNDFQGTSIPKFIGSLKKLRYLDFSNAGFAGTIPPQLGNLSNLQYLDLNVHFQALSANNLEWLSRLVSLQYLDMEGVNLEKANGWMEAISMLPSLLQLYLPICRLNNSRSFFPSLSSPNFTSLAVLDLRSNYLHGPLSFGNMTSLVELYLSWNNFQGELPRTMGSLCKLRTLDLGYNKFSGEMHEFVESLSGCVRLSFLKELHLGFNQLNGTVPETLGQLSELVSFDISSNSLEGAISEGHFTNLSKLKVLYMYSNSLVLNVSSEWVPPFQLNILAMSFCKLGPQFPAWLQSQKGISYLGLSNTQILGTMPSWFWNLSSQINFIDLSQNQISGKLPISFKFNGWYIDLSSNHFNGPVPFFSPNVRHMDLSNNSFSGSIPSSIGEMMPELDYLSLSHNLINGSLPTSICKLRNLVALDLKENHLSGVLPKCWGDSMRLMVMDLANNDLGGDIPSSIGYLLELQSLHLSSNNLSGELPLTLKNCTRLETLDLGENELSGNIPTWIGESLSLLKFLRLRSNMFCGNIPPQLSYLTSLRLLDLAQNNLSGSIPQSFYNFSAMSFVAMKEGRLVSILGYGESVLVAMKGRVDEYKEILWLVRSIDLSSNSLSGEIPEELTRLSGLQSLNLSENHLIGHIPKGISDLRWLETLDLSRNQLSGPIPPGLSALTFLNHLNFSYNNFSGKIPFGNQLQTLDDPFIYVGNPNLCEPQLKGKCPGEETFQSLVPNGNDKGDDKEDGDMSEKLIFCLAMGLGFAAGFSTFFCVLLLKKSWRYAYFQFFDDMKDWLMEMVAPKPSTTQNKKSRRSRGSS